MTGLIIGEVSFSEGKTGQVIWEHLVVQFRLPIAS